MILPVVLSPPFSMLIMATCEARFNVLIVSMSLVEPNTCVCVVKILPPISIIVTTNSSFDSPLRTTDNWSLHGTGNTSLIVSVDPLVLDVEFPQLIRLLVLDLLHPLPSVTVTVAVALAHNPVATFVVDDVLQA
jgi:hypothetical protein